MCSYKAEIKPVVEQKCGEEADSMACDPLPHRHCNKERKGRKEGEMEMASFDRPGLTCHFGECQWLGPGSWPLTLSGISRRGR